MIYLCSNTIPTNLGADVTHLALAQIKFETFTLDFAEFGAAIFTSKNALCALAANDVKPTDVEVFAIGEACAAAARDFGFERVYVAQNHHGLEFAHEIAPKLKGKKAVFVRAKEVVSDVAGELRKSGVNLAEIVAYQNLSAPISNLKPPQDGALIVFASPKNAKLFYEKFGWKNSWRALAIGNATAAALGAFCEPVISEKQDINYCLDLARKLVQI